jgi:excisionase family DNA binding protein
MKKLVAIYTRVSSEDLEIPASTRRQERSCRMNATERGWEVADVWEDVDISAYKQHVRRPAFEDLMKVVAGAKVDGVLVWKLDRLVRRTADFERFWLRCDLAGVFLASATEPIDSTTDLGLAVIRILVTFANVESTSISLRLRARNEEKARAGLYLGPGRMFGVNQDWTSLVEEEAIFIQEACQRVLNGESLSAIATDWRRRNIRGVRGGALSAQSLGRMLTSPHMVGDNTYRGKVVAKGCFPPILDPLTAARVRATLAVPRRKFEPPPPYLLTGLLRCAKCGGRFYGATHIQRLVSGKVIRTPTYRCHGGSTGCGKVQIQAAFVEDLIVSAVLYRLEKRPTIRPNIQPPPDAPEKLAVAFERHATALRTLVRDYYVTRSLTREEWFAARDGLEHQLILEQRALLPQWRPSISRNSRVRPRFRADWESLDLSHRRDIIASELECANISPCTTRGVLDPLRVRAVWWDDGPELSASPWRSTRTVRVDSWDADLWMGTEEVSVRLGFSCTTITRMSRSGQLDPVRLGTHYRFLRSDIEAAAQLWVGTISVSEAGVRSGLRHELLLDAIERGELSATRRGKLFCIRPEDLDSFAKALGDARSELIGTPEAAKLLGVTQQTIRQMVHRGDLRGIRCRHWIVLRRKEVNEVAERLAKARANDDAVSSPEAKHPQSVTSSRSCSA